MFPSVMGVMENSYHKVQISLPPSTPNKQKWLVFKHVHLYINHECLLKLIPHFRKQNVI